MNSAELKGKVQTQTWEERLVLLSDWMNLISWSTSWSKPCPLQSLSNKLSTPARHQDWDILTLLWHIPACVFQNTCKCAPITFSWLKSNTDLWSWGGSGGHGAPADWPSGATVWWRHRRLQSPSRWPTGQRPRWATTGESCHSAWRRNRCTRRKKVSRSNSRCNRYFHCYLLDVQAWIHSWMQSRHTVASSHIWICS